MDFFFIYWCIAGLLGICIILLTFYFENKSFGRQVEEQYKTKPIVLDVSVEFIMYCIAVVIGVCLLIVFGGMTLFMGIGIAWTTMTHKKDWSKSKFWGETLFVVKRKGSKS